MVYEHTGTMGRCRLLNPHALNRESPAKSNSQLAENNDTHFRNAFGEAALACDMRHSAFKPT